MSLPLYKLPRWFYILSPLIGLIGIHRFTTGFFLAKKSLPHSSHCESDSAKNLLWDVLGLSTEELKRLQDLDILPRHTMDGVGEIEKSQGCWMSRRVDRMAVIVVDALRFDFAAEHLPKSVGARMIASDVNDHGARGRSQLFQFVADPPTVTMQRLKGLTTGGLPTFADISGSFGGANVDEDSWVKQLYEVPLARRGVKFGDEDDKIGNTHMAFVGDDTWVDLFPFQFNDSHPYPSFNTRDLDTVDDGCMLHLPRLLTSFGNQTQGLESNSLFEVVVVHFLGVDHVGHTYGPHNAHMVKKLKQMDDALQTVFSKIDDADTECQAAFVFGDHGMTEDGNHGGGTTDETNAALFAHYSPGCGDLGPSLNITGSEIGSHSEHAFNAINQIDLVPTISLLLGLPIPFANLGGVVPGLLPNPHRDADLAEAPFAATALALNAAQVWNYLSTYSLTANKLPSEPLSELKAILDEATSRFKNALAQANGFDSFAYREACGLYKYFLSEATNLGKQVWTRFDTFQMGVGVTMLLISLVLRIPSLLSFQIPVKKAKLEVMTSNPSRLLATYKFVESIGVLLFLIFHCVLLTFSNSYIISEGTIVQFMLSILCLTTVIYRVHNLLHNKQSILRTEVGAPLLIILSSRMNSMCISGHGLDPMIRKHWSHNVHVFLTSLGILAAMRMTYFLKNGKRHQYEILHVGMDIGAIACLGFSWIEKRSLDVSHHGYLTSKFSLFICVVGFAMIMAQLFMSRSPNTPKKRDQDPQKNVRMHETVLLKILLFIITVTGPSTASSGVLFVLQGFALSSLTGESGMRQLRAPVLAMIWRLTIRHAFFATGHACSFSHLQFSAAFVATETFNFAIAGSSLFFNTFGWDILGVCLLATVSKRSKRPEILSWFCFYQVVETTSACISVSIMKRHLMVWAIFAPRFVFSSLSLVLCNLHNLFELAFSRQNAAVSDKHKD